MRLLEHPTPEGIVLRVDTRLRPIGGAQRFAELEAGTLRPFVYRRYLDYGMFASLREMKAVIERQVARRDTVSHRDCRATIGVQGYARA